MDALFTAPSPREMFANKKAPVKGAFFHGDYFLRRGDFFAFVLGAVAGF